LVYSYVNQSAAYLQPTLTERSGNSSLPESGTSCRRQLPADTNGGRGKRHLTSKVALK